MTIGLLQDRLENIKRILIGLCSQNLATIANILSSIHRTSTRSLNIGLPRNLSGNVICNVEKQLTLNIVICWVTLIRLFYLFSIKLHVISWSTPSCFFIPRHMVRKSEPTFTILTVILKVVEGRVQVVFTLPAEPCAVILWVEWKTLFNGLFFICVGRVPAIVSKRALICFFTLFITGS